MTRAARRAMLVTLAVALLSGCGGKDGGGQPATDSGADSGGGGVPSEAPPLRRPVTLLWPGTAAQGLVPRDAEIFATRDPADQARQVAGLLLAGAPDEGVAAPLPPGTKLTALFVDARGTAYVSLSSEAVAGAPGGSLWEQLAVHSLSGSLVRNVSQIRRMQLLIDGREIETLNGHLDLRGPVTFDESLVAP